MKLINRILKKKQKDIELTNEQRVSEAQGKVQFGLAMFQEANDLIEEANQTLESVIESDTHKMMEIEKNREKAFDELQANKALQENLKSFIR